MSSTATSLMPKERLEVLFEEFAELSGQRNAIDGRIVDVVAEFDHDGLCGMTGARSVAALVAWKLGMSSTTANTIATVAHRLGEFPRCAQGMREGRFSLDQVGAIAGKAASGPDEHYANMATVATVNQLRTAINLEPRPKPHPTPNPTPSPSPTLSPKPTPTLTLRSSPDTSLSPCPCRSRDRSRHGRSPAPPARRPPPTGSSCRTTRPPPSTPHCSPITTR